MTRKTFRGEIQLFNNIYYSYELAAEHGNEVRVSYDIHDANSVIVRRADGSYICDAIWNGNKVDAFAKPVIEQNWRNASGAALHGPRRKSKRLNASLLPAITQKPDFNLGYGLERPEKKEKEELYLFASERERNLKKNGTNNR